MPTTLGSSFLQPTLGALLIGILLSCILFGILTLQTYLYYMKFPEDRIQLKILVGFIWLLELAHCISIMHTIYDYAVIGYGDLQVFIRLPTSLSVAILFTAIIGPTVQIFYAERIRIVSGGKLIVPIFCWLMSLLHFSTTLVSSIKAIQMTSLVQYEEDWKWLLTTALSIGVSVDVIISASLCYFLSKLKTKSTVKRTTQAIDKIMVWTIQTGLLNSIASAATMICFLAIPNSRELFRFFTIPSSPA
ncbi:hypothetical protein BDN70DRAFT_880887 [Pholiota conissans]|uniref:DUF6534 domain-containing protein n=1 Tax=Pholiota conissans TaxID=109636 RepID=A0A9P5YYU6_9AGAR|nr:hypothetical protein BDN70DRAFT_880887 [Pholiota conissans]